MAQAAAAGFHVLVTADLGIAHSHNLKTLPLAVVVLHAESTAIIDVEPLVPELLALLQVIQPNTLTHVGDR